MLALAHLYTFNDGLANDWVGSAHATLVNGAAISGGQLVLANAGVASGESATVQHMRLPAGVLPDGDATVAIWFTATTTENWARVFDFGELVAGQVDSRLFLTPRSGFDDARAVLRPAGSAERAAIAATFDDGAEHMAAVVVDVSAGALRLYIDGVEAGSAPLDGASAGSVNDAVAYVGRSLLDGDPGWTGSINELRIYDDARSAEALLADATAGPADAIRSPLVRQMEYLDRGLVVVRRSTSQTYVGWRLLGMDPPDIAFNVYRSTAGGAAVRLNAAPLTQTTDFVDSAANAAAANEYFVRPLIGGVELAASESFTLPANSPVRQYLVVPLQIPAGGAVPNYQDPGQMLPFSYNANDASVGDVDGDGQYEIILKWEPSNAQDNSNSGYTGNVLVDAYKLDGTRLWRIDLGRNIRAGAHYTQFIVYDFDGDGRAEVAMRTAPGTVDGQGNPVLLGSDSASADYRNSSGYILAGPEYLTIFNGQTGAAMATVPFEPARGSVSQWGDSYGNRVDRFLAGVAYLDGQRPSLIMARGYYGPQSSGGQARNEVAAYDFRNGQLALRWHFKAGRNINDNVNGAYISQGTHSLSIADVDNDGKDEIIYGAAAIDDTGVGLYSTGLGHGDALHVSDMIPERPGLEVFQVHESPGSNGLIGASVRDARTGEILFTVPATNDVGRGVALDIDPNHAGYEYWATTSFSGETRSVYDSQGDAIYATPGNMMYNFGVWWDADPLRELLDGTTISDWNAATAGRQNFNLGNSSRASNNGTKSTPALSADILGDWREEVIWRRSDNAALQIWTTTISATSRMYTLMHDAQYREAIAWQNVAYNQPPHPSFFVGAGMDSPPTPQIYVATAAARPTGDFDGDHAVDALDLALWRLNAGQLALTGPQVADADADLDVDGADFLAWQRNLGAPAQAAAVHREFEGTIVKDARDEAFASVAAAWEASGAAASREPVGSRHIVEQLGKGGEAVAPLAIASLGETRLLREAFSKLLERADGQSKRQLDEWRSAFSLESGLPFDRALADCWL